MSDRSPLSLSPSLDSSSKTFLVGFVIANVVGIQYYSSTVNGQEVVDLVREPINPHDRNTIKVLNTRLEQVGHIERGVAAVLPLVLNPGLAVVEGIVPKPPPNRSAYGLPCKVHIFSFFDYIDDVRKAITDGSLQLYSSSDHWIRLRGMPSSPAFDVNPLVATALVTIYVRLNEMELARRLFDEMPVKNLTS